MTTWVVQHGLVGADGQLPFEYASPLYDLFTVGPQHVDTNVERLLRQAAGLPSDLDVLDEHQGLLDDDVVLLARQDLTSLAASLWWIDAMTQRGSDVQRVRLAVVPVFAPAEVVVSAVRDAQAIAEDLEPLRALRRVIARDDDALTLPIASVTPARRPWAELCARMRDFLPDARGLDLVDVRLLDAVGSEWTRVVPVVSRVFASQDDANRVGDVVLWRRLLELAEHRPAKHPRDQDDDDEPTKLIELELEGPISMRFARVRRTALGDQVLAGRDVLEVRAYDRWVGGRFLTCDRILRAPSLRRA
ncbi:hypothetical protein [Sandaracinus amylolyticus]|uniref:Uncharacterized protein n=1 Tax=Sandaracinus amylolyticus TaxID=927083 RepID=A0A0F6SHD5_9BACT|nr:hypothetical protein [Sandaracinus amylolyticus]AKF10254.1 hypothetical protein DB32_007403 [Sandaracinus amylolyticus]